MPRLAYHEADAAAQFLCDAFGFTETGRFAPGGKIIHAEFALNGETLFAIGSEAENTHSPNRLGGVTVQLFCYVNDVDAHCEHARTQGASIVSEPKDQFWGDRSYDALDLEGHRWTFRKHVKDVPLEALIPE